MTLLFSIPALIWKAAVLSGTLYINGVRADGLRGFEMEDVDIRIDQNGDIHVTAPQYNVEPLEDATHVPVNSTQGIAAASWWLFTVDESSQGHVADVLINGSLVRKVRSGEEQVIVDVGPYLRHGENTVLLAPSTGNGSGTLHVYLGEGRNDTGTVVIDEPRVHLTLSSSLGGGSSSRQTSEFSVP